jgi:electron transfer flavoprotein alpha subunit/NAD-dependent dihydropyrimidine dehydrogenase PreA subunit
MAIFIDYDLCTGCKRCEKICPYNGIEVKDGKALVNERCTSCGACIDTCPENAISSDVKEKEVPDFRDRKGIWVFAEQADGAMAKVTKELLGLGQSLAKDLNQELSAVLLGNNVDHFIEELQAYGAQNVYLAQHELLSVYQTNPYTKVISEIILTNKPNIFLIGATPIGRDLAPRISMRLNLGLTADCTELSIDQEDGLLLQTRPAFGGNLMATIKTLYSRPQMATVRPGVMESKRIGTSSNCEVIHVDSSLTKEDAVTRVLEFVGEKKKVVSLNDAKVIVAGGRGVGSEEGLKPLFELAEALGGEVAGTRIVVEEGWLPVERQVGQTGQTVRPELYVACGISGAIQHRAGMLGSRYVIAINKDERAPIFEAADWGIVGDLHEVVPTLTNAILNRKGK